MVYRPLLFITQLVVIVTLGAIHLAALEWYLYWQYPWLDVLSHFLGGLWLALASVWLFSYVGRKIDLTTILTLVLIISIAWEIFEYLTGIPRESNYALDTVIDLIMDLCGGILGFFLGGQMARGTITTYEASESNSSEPPRAA